jgi:hypothetical protein
MGRRRSGVVSSAIERALWYFEGMEGTGFSEDEVRVHVGFEEGKGHAIVEDVDDVLFVLLCGFVEEVWWRASPGCR